MINSLLILLEDQLFSEYQPFPEKPPFRERLATWLGQIRCDKDRQVLFRFVPWLLYVGRREMESMYRAAYVDPITRWIIDDAKLDIADPGFDKLFSEAVQATWFGSIAGMDIGSFFRVNGIRGQSLRPDFRVLSRLADLEKVQSYLDGPISKLATYDRVVAVEDYVGSGEQMNEASVILGGLERVRVLLCPIVVAPGGVSAGQAIQSEHSRISFSPLFIIPPTAILDKTRTTGEPVFFARLRQLLSSTWAAVQGTIRDTQLYSPYGFQNTGSLVLTYLNCPDNVPPLVHHQSDKWQPLFRRQYREN